MHLPKSKIRFFSKNGHYYCTTKEISKSYQKYQENKTFEFPQHIYGQPKGKLIKIEVEDCPMPGKQSWVELDTARTAFICVGMDSNRN